MFSPDMTGSPYDSVGSGEINDVNDHESMMLPGQYSPSMEHSTKMAGELVPLRNSSDYTPTDDKAIMGQIKNTSPNRTSSSRVNIVPMRKP